MIRQFLPLLFLICLAALSGCEQGGSVDGKVQAARARNDGPAMWVVKDHDSTLYLYGTVHLLPSDLDWQRDDMKDAFKEAGTVFFELDTGRAGQLEASLLTQQLGLISSGTRLSDRLDNYQLKLLEAAANNGNLPLASLDSMRPWLASEFLTVAAAGNAGLSPDLAADEALKSRAQRLGKNIVYLDTTECQIRATSDQPDFVQMMLLTDTLEGFGSIGSNLSKIADAWSVGQVDYLTAKTVIALSSRSPELYNTLLKDRNREWAGEFTRFMEGNDTGFAAVGAAHLLGEDSVQNFLRDQGYVVSRYYAFQGENVIKPVFQ
ncbi:MAG: TraB/GumN family protein [Alphaproteobacteria bacterium]